MLISASITATLTRLGLRPTPIGRVEVSSTTIHELRVREKWSPKENWEVVRIRETDAMQKKSYSCPPSENLSSYISLRIWRIWGPERGWDLPEVTP